MGRYHWKSHRLGPTQKMLWKEGFSLVFFLCTRYTNCLKQYRRHGCPRCVQTKFWCFSGYVNLCTCSSPAATPSGFQTNSHVVEHRRSSCNVKRNTLDILWESTRMIGCVPRFWLFFFVILEFWGRFYFLINQWGVRNICHVLFFGEFYLYRR